MQASQEFHLAQAYRSRNKLRQVVYRPDKNRKHPWISYYKGTPGMLFSTLEAAQTFHILQGEPLVLIKQS